MAKELQSGKNTWFSKIPATRSRSHHDESIELKDKQNNCGVEKR